MMEKRLDRARFFYEACGRRPTLAALLVWVVPAFLCSGCVALVAGAAGGTTGAAYVMGKLQDEINHPVPAVHQATVAALKALDLPLSENRADQMTARVESEFSDGKHVTIDLESFANARTQVTIRVGLIGDEARSLRILDAIKKQLGQPS